MTRLLVPSLFTLFLLWGPMSSAFKVSTVKNFRPVFPDDPSCRFFRSASLDELSEADGQRLLAELGPGLTVIDLRNQDEIDKPIRTSGSLAFYEQLPNLHHVPILKNVDAFWNEAIGRMDGPTKVRATLQTITQAGALDRAAARMLEDNGLSMLYTILLVTGAPQLQQAVTICAKSSGPVVFHCQKGKDRTGVLAMLLQSCRGVAEEEIVKQYAMSGDLLDEGKDDKDKRGRGGTMLDWSKFRGSPALAMEDTLEWIRQRHGSVVEGYLVNYLGLDSATIQQLSK